MKRSPNACFLLSLLLIGLAFTTTLTAQKSPIRIDRFPAAPIGTQNSRVATPLSDMEPMPLVAPIFIEDAGTTSSLVLVNSTSVSAGATITLRSLSGSELATIHRQLAPHAQLEIPVVSLLAGVGKPTSVGSLTVIQDANLRGMAIASQLLLTRTSGANPSYVDEELAMPQITGSSTLRGVTDQSDGVALLAITSTVNWEQHATLRCLSETQARQPAAITLAPYATALVSGCSGQTVQDFDSYARGMFAAQGTTEPRVSSGVLGYELVTDGGAGAISAFGVSPHQHGGNLIFSGVPFTDPAEVYSPNSVFAGVPFGSQDALPNGIYKPRVSFANFAVTPAHITISIATTQPANLPVPTTPGTSPEQVVLRKLTIAPRRSVELDLSDATAQNGLLQSFLVETDKQPGEVIGKAVSRTDGTGSLYQIELLNKDQMGQENAGIHPWSVEGDSESHLLLFNYSKQDRVFSVSISNGEILWNNLYTLAPNETREISINELIQDKIPDRKGKVLVPDLRSGTVNWMVPDPGEGTGRLMVTSRSRGMARNFSCGNFVVVCYLDLLTYENSLLDGTSGVPWGADPEFCSAWGPGQCSGGNQLGFGSASYSWSIGASNILTSNQLSSSSPLVNGVGPGIGSGYVTASAEGCSGGGGGSLPVTPSVTFSQMNPGIAQGSSTSVTAVVTPAGSTTPVTLTLSTTAGTGAAIFTSGGTIAAGGASTVITSSAGITIKGVTASSVTGNIILNAKAPTGEGSGTTPVATNPQAFSVVTVSQSPSVIHMSSGDTNDLLNVVVTPAGIDSQAGSSISHTLNSNPNSASTATVTFNPPSSYSGNDNWGISIGGSNSPSGIFTATAHAGGAGSSQSTSIEVPPQIMIQTAVGEAGLQTGLGDASISSLLLVGKNRFGDSNFPGGTASTWQAVLVPAQFYGASNTTPNGVSPELSDATYVYDGTSTVTIPSGCKGYWSPTNAQYTTLQGWASKTAGSITDASWPNSVGAPTLWPGQPKQAVVKTSIANNARSGYTSAPAFVLMQLAPSSSAPAVITVP